MDARSELSEFLKSRRARLRPADVGLRDYGGRRRVAGLRREELAQAAGVSAAHYTRLEQGRPDSVSADVLDAIATALRLDDDERAYLHHVAHPAAPCAGGVAPVRPGLRNLLASFDTTAALLVGRFTEIIGWNPLAAAVFTDFGAMPAEARTITDLLFGDHGLRTLHGDGWETAALEHVAHLRVLSAHFRGDPRIDAHIARVAAASPEFAAMWAAYPVSRVRDRVYRLHHPVVGVLELYGELVMLPGDSEYSGLDLLAAEPGSPSDTALRKLAADAGTGAVIPSR
ncbi:helix-turn-helix transcriptional regulator [Yinghuangia seranimata]|uniref:helix-turn-helix transcriptional regulator n=1 Tax=Yinghuangia seranimata TaxID=408067 RepID=UPI00248D2407|nr:helix-turn-helix transcriptional regulator [Yinghuangia seranimata]MDI2130288.1 helix-turn-helix transcriptional regulator [Yinghuangia seranimata]